MAVAICGSGLASLNGMLHFAAGINTFTLLKHACWQLKTLLGLGWVSLLTVWAFWHNFGVHNTHAAGLGCSELSPLTAIVFSAI